MLFELPTFHAVLNPCPIDWAAFVAHPAGHFCGRCQRVVQDFSQSENPIADLAAARSASPDGRVCGSFRREQIAPAHPLAPRLRRFLLALVLVVGQGLSAHEAWAQVRRQGIDYEQLITKPEQARVGASKRDLTAVDTSSRPFLGMVEQIPTFRGGGIRELSAYIQQQIKWPQTEELARTAGRVFASFTVGADGRVHDARIVKGLAPLLDAEVLRVISQLQGFKPGMQNGKPVAVGMTVPVTFKP